MFAEKLRQFRHGEEIGERHASIGATGRFVGVFVLAAEKEKVFVRDVAEELRQLPPGVQPATNELADRTLRMADAPLNRFERLESALNNVQIDDRARSIAQLIQPLILEERRVERSSNGFRFYLFAAENSTNVQIQLVQIERRLTNDRLKIDTSTRNAFETNRPTSVICVRERRESGK